jgi:hypothetical protein
VLGVALWRVPLGKLSAIAQTPGPAQNAGTSRAAATSSSIDSRESAVAAEPIVPPPSNLEQLLAKTREDRSKKS